MPLPPSKALSSYTTGKCCLCNGFFGLRADGEFSLCNLCLFVLCVYFVSEKLISGGGGGGGGFEHYENIINLIGRPQKSTVSGVNYKSDSIASVIQPPRNRDYKWL